MTFPLDGLVWLLLLLGPLLILQRKVHFEIQALLLILTRRMDIVTVLFALLFLPGVFIHELSHFIVARLVGVRTGNFSVLPHNLGNGKLRLGYVETASSDVIRDSLIGAAPLLIGSFIVVYIAQVRFGFTSIINIFSFENPKMVLDALMNLRSVPDFWLWFYLLFAISSTMLPSASDRRAWLPLAGIFVLFGILGLFLGIGPWVLRNLLPTLNAGLRALALVFGISGAIHLLLLVPFFLFRSSLSKITGLEIQT